MSHIYASEHCLVEHVGDANSDGVCSRSGRLTAAVLPCWGRATCHGRSDA